MELSPERKPLSRVQQNVLARSERRLLTWICGKLPLWVTPDKLTTTGMIGAVMIFFGYALSSFAVDWLYLALAGYAVQWFGDSLDGSLARYRHIERPSYGYFIDHSCDGAAVLLIMAGMGLSPYVAMTIAMLALAGYLLLAIHAFLSARVIGELKLSYLAAGPTEIRLLLITLTVIMLINGKVSNLFDGYSGYDVFIGACAAVLMALFVVQTAITGRQLALLERR
ncbi:CDP-alcohol phosphatidyltransferase family protein [Hephaestia mangrovi]|uniref:CDP-alcohol phosphatidyltransferase family protein n=1 Tax=Hephaestia mangrovi TaxID=2873268 RepID=UPI001CA6B391|nr:CDP-alcohol phosphatidyltransferase family protein [Hephaestia mangrovi]MBY8826971.1 CDP-alcohol phosphatidyltransferase family protein [Hephaestia mangrovi]